MHFTDQLGSASYSCWFRLGSALSFVPVYHFLQPQNSSLLFPVSIPHPLSLSLCSISASLRILAYFFMYSYRSLSLCSISASLRILAYFSLYSYRTQSLCPCVAFLQPQNSSLLFPVFVPHPVAGFILGTGSSWLLLAVSDNSGGKWSFWK